MGKKRPNNYWKNSENIIDGINSVVREIGHFPTAKELQEIDSGLASAVYQHYSSLNKLRSKMGYDLLQKSPGYWRNWTNVKRELEPLINNFGRIPKNKELNTMGKSGLVTAVIRYHGGLSKVAKKLGYELEKKAAGYWQNIENIKREIKIIRKKLGHFPTLHDLCSTGLISSINRYHGGLVKVAKIMGHNGNLSRQKDDGYWRNLNNIKRELKQIIAKLGHFPTYNEILKINSSLCYGIYSHHRSLNKIRGIMKYEPPVKPIGYWKNIENVERELEPIIKELGRFPIQRELFDKGKSSLSTAIQKYHGGSDKVRKLMGYPSRENYKIKIPKQLVYLINTEPKAKYAVENAVKLSDPKEIDVTVADVLSVIWDGRIERKEIIDMLQKPSVGSYLGKFSRNKGLNELPDFLDAAEALLPYDKNNAIRDLIKKRVETWLYDEHLKAKPSKKEIYSALEQIAEQAERLK